MANLVIPELTRPGGGHATHYYKQQGYLDAVTYPGYAGPAPAYSSSADGFTNVTGADSLRIPACDNDGNALTRVDGNGVTTAYTHSADPQSLLTLVHYAYPSGYAGTQIADVSLTYDGYGRRASMADGTGTQSYAYDDLGLPLSITTAYAGPPSETISYAYWPDGSRQTMSVSALSGGFSYTYDADGRMTGLTNPFGEASSWQYLGNGWLSGQGLGDGASVGYTRNALGEVIGLSNLSTVTDGSGTHSQVAYDALAYDGAGDRLSDSYNPGGFLPGGYQNLTGYAYDGRSQLLQQSLSVSSGPGGGSPTTTAFAYDGGSGTGPGNPTTFRGAGHAFNADNQDISNTYDGDGSPATYQGQATAFDPESRMTAYGTALTCGYTGDGLRAWKQDPPQKLSPKGGRTSGISPVVAGLTYFLYDGDEPVCEMNSAGTVTAVNTLGASGLLSRNSGGSSTFYEFDPQGGVAQRLDGGGRVLRSDRFDAFGGDQNTSAAPDPWGFGARWGGYTDAETGLVLCTHRYYDPAAGRWLTRDPAGYVGGIDLYAYCQNDPVNEIDPSGLQKTVISGTINNGGELGGTGGTMIFKNPVIIYGTISNGGIGGTGGTMVFENGVIMHPGSGHTPTGGPASPPVNVGVGVDVPSPGGSVGSTLLNAGGQVIIGSLAGAGGNLLYNGGGILDPFGPPPAAPAEPGGGASPGSSGGTSCPAGTSSNIQNYPCIPGYTCSGDPFGPGGHGFGGIAPAL